MENEEVLQGLNGEEYRIFWEEWDSKLNLKRNFPDLYKLPMLSSVQDSNVTTSCGTLVPGIITESIALSTFEDKFYSAYLADNYLSASIVGEADPYYNCHGYAWDMVHYYPPYTYGP